MASFAESTFTIRAVNRSQQAFSQIQKSVGNLDRKFGNLGSMLTNRLAPAFAAVFAGSRIIDTITKFERLEASLKTVTGSAEKAATAFGLIQEFADKTPFQLEEVTASFIKLKALGLTPSEAALKSYGNTAIAMGKSLDQMIEAVADATTGEFERLKEFGIKARTQGEQVTFTFQGISTTVGKNAAEIEAYLRAIGDVQFAGAIEAKAHTLVTAIAKMKGAFSKLVIAIGESGLTEILVDIANGIKWLVDTITASIEPIKLAHLTMTVEIVKFGRMFIAVLQGVGDAFIAFASGIADRFEALGQDLAAFINDPLSGVSFENTKRVLETGLVDSMKSAFDKALLEADEFNKKLDEKLGQHRSEVAAKGEKKSGSLEDMFGKTPGDNSSANTSGSSKITDRHSKLKQESKETTGEIESDFKSLGDQIGDSIASSLTQAGGKFNSFADLAKNVLGDVGKMLLNNMFSGGGAGGGIGGLIGGMFGGGGGMSGMGSMFGGFFADGGKLSPGKFGVVGENGPELAFAGNSPLNIMPDMPGGGSVTINMNVQTPDVVSFRQSSSQIAADVARQIERARRNL